jgi:hypothetical protein
MDPAFFERVISAVEPHVLSRLSALDFEMAYQTRVAIDRIRFAIKQTEQFAEHSVQVREVLFQLLDALDRLESVERRFQNRSKNSAPEGIRAERD